MLSLGLAFALAPQLVAHKSDPIPIERPNIAIILVDDIGVDLIGAYGEAPIAAPCTPEIDALADQGLLFRNAYTNPWCSPSRAQVLTGRHSFRTGIGQIIGAGGHQSGLPLAEVLLPEILTGYSSAAIGKWHLANPEEMNGDGQGVMHPLLSGFDSFVGTTHNVGVGPVPPGPCLEDCDDGPPWTYYQWVKTIQCDQVCSNAYITTDVELEAMQAALSMPAPWFLYVSYHSAHVPVHVPPASLCPGLAGCACNTVTPASSDVEKTKAMVEALDTSIGNLVTTLRAVDPNVYVFLLGDNGTYSGASEGPPNGCFDPNRAKGTVYEAGTNVPFLAIGPGVPVREIDALVCSTDLFATVTELAHVPLPPVPLDSVSLVPYLVDDSPPLRNTVYTEYFEPNGSLAGAEFHERSVRNNRYKLIRNTNSVGETVEELYNLQLDPCESNNLCPGILCSGLSGEALANYQMLQARMMQLGVY